MIAYHDVTKIYRSLLPHRRPVKAVDGFSLRIAPGEVLGLAGPNGAGKSTLIALLLGYLRPTTGQVEIDGKAPRAFIESRGIGYMSELVAIPPKWGMEHALARYALLAGIGDDAVRSRVDAVVGELGLEEHRSKKVRQLSKGNLQRVGLAQALLRDESILVLDEPTHGLDPVWTQRFRELVEGLRSPERTMLIASHNLDELERVSDRVAIIDHGRLQRVVKTGRAGSGGVWGSGGEGGGGGAASIAARYRLSLASGHEHVTSIFPDAREIRVGEYEVGVSSVTALNASIATLISRGGLITSVAPSYSALEQQFRDAVGGAEVVRKGTA